LIPLATTALQSLSKYRLERSEQLDASGRPVHIDSGYASGAHRELVQRRWPQFHRRAPAED
jgi:hypothetical protein